MNSPTAYMPLPSPLKDGSRGAAPTLPAGLSLTGLVLFVSSALILASGYMSLRPEIMGLALHPMLVPIAIAFPLVVLSRIYEFPMRVLLGLSLFVGIYLVSIVNGTSFSLSEFFKMGAAFVTIVTCALLVRKRGDFVAGSLGLSIGIALLAWKGLTADGANDVMDGANKNSYSLFALPAVLLAGFICLHMRNTPAVVRGALIASTLPALFVIFLGGNRSGYLGAVIVGLMLFWDQRGRGMILVAAVTGAVVLLISQYGDTRIFDERMRQTVEGNKSDDLRVRLFQGSLEIALENPIIGVSPQAFPSHLATKLGFRGAQLESHNTLGHIMGGSGFFCLLAYGAFVLSMMFPFPTSEWPRQGRHDPLYEARSLCRMMIVLWVIRGMFTREILYNPAFNVGLGLCIGLLVLAMSSRQSSQAPIVAAGHR